MAKIVVALDGSPGSEKALEAAVKLAQRDGGKLAAVTVLNRTDGPYPEHLTESIQSQAHRYLNDILQAAANYARSRGVQLTPILREGHPAAAIIDCAEQEKAEILLVGSKGKTPSLSGIGGTADQVSGHSPCTVMIVK
jgi:nucleotide-binding universal stress UspA family protein